MKLSINLKAESKKIVEFNESFGYTADRLEVAQNLWLMLTPDERYEIGLIVLKNNPDIKIAKRLTESLKIIANMVDDL